MNSKKLLTITLLGIIFLAGCSGVDATEREAHNELNSTELQEGDNSVSSYTVVTLENHGGVVCIIIQEGSVGSVAMDCLAPHETPVGWDEG